MWAMSSPKAVLVSLEVSCPRIHAVALTGRDPAMSEDQDGRDMRASGLRLGARSASGQGNGLGGDVIGRQELVGEASAFESCKGFEDAIVMFVLGRDQAKEEPVSRKITGAGGRRDRSRGSQPCSTAHHR